LATKLSITPEREDGEISYSGAQRSL